jgi:hypothetical protein
VPDAPQLRVGASALGAKFTCPTRGPRGQESPRFPFNKPERMAHLPCDRIRRGNPHTLSRLYISGGSKMTANEQPDHAQLVTLLEQAKALNLTMFPDQQKYG